MPNPTEWSIDPSKSTISFKVDPLIFSAVKGTFKLFDAKIETTGDDFSTMKISLWIDAASISTGDLERDEDLRSDNFFDVEHHKEITFTSGTFKMPSGEEPHEITGELTMKGITKEVTIEVQSVNILNADNEKTEFSVSAKLNRKDWGVISYGSSKIGGLMESEEVAVSSTVTLVRKGDEENRL